MAKSKRTVGNERPEHRHKWSRRKYVLAGNITLFDSANASRTVTFGLSGASDPVLTASKGYRVCENGRCGAVKYPNGLVITIYAQRTPRRKETPDGR